MTADGVSAAPAEWRFDAIGTSWRLQTHDPLDRAVRRRVRRLISDFDAQWSRFRPDSLVAELSRGAGSVREPEDAEAMLAEFDALSRASHGAISPLVGVSLERLGYDAEYSFVDRGSRPAPPDWRALLRCSGGRLRLASPTMIDVGAVAKGRLVDRVLDLLAGGLRGGIVVDAGGDLAVRGVTIRVGLEHPYDAARAVGVWEISDAALCASAINRRAWGNGLHHVIDARTGLPATSIAATWAVAPVAMRADAVATALFFEGGPELAGRWSVPWVRMHTDGRVDWSPGSKAELFV